MAGGAVLVDVDQIRDQFGRGEFSVYFHALQEALKDGLTGDDLLYVVNQGEIIEEYPERDRSLLFATVPDGIPVHVVIDFRNEHDLQIVTIYVPDRRDWINYRRRRRRKR